MSKLGEIITVKVDPDTNGGLAEAPAVVTGVYERGELRVRVLTDDSVRNYVGEDGEPFVYDDAAAPTTAPAQQTEPAPAAVPTSDQLAQMSAEDRAQLAAELQQLDNAQAPGGDGSLGTGE